MRSRIWAGILQDMASGDEAVTSGKLVFRRGQAEDRDVLDEMTLAGVRYWGHDVHHPEAYQGLVESLTSQDGPEAHTVFLLKDEAEVVAFYELQDRDGYVELVRMFMRPDLIGHGFGKKLWNHAVDRAAGNHDRMLILSDPSAIGFYTAMGATLERRQEVAPGFELGVFWYNLA